MTAKIEENDIEIDVKFDLSSWTITAVNWEAAGNKVNHSCQHEHGWQLND